MGLSQGELFGGIPRPAGRGIDAIAARLPDKALITAPDVATALDVKIDVVYRWIDAGLFDYIDVGGGAIGKPRWRIVRESLLGFLSSRMCCDRRVWK